MIAQVYRKLLTILKQNTVFVRAGVYKENILIDKERIILQGENRNKTIIDGSGENNVISIKSDNVTVQDLPFKIVETIMISILVTQE